MTLEIGLLVASLLVMLCAAAGVGLLSAMLYPAAFTRLARLAPATRANVLFAWVTAPVWLSNIILLLVLSPSIAHTLGIGVDHCHDHGHHVHLCVIHTPWLVGSSIEWFVFGGLLTLAAASLVPVAARWKTARGTFRMLLSLSKPSTEVDGMRLVSSQRHFVFTAGMLRPHIFLSDTLLDAIQPRELATVVAHERAHQRRKDGLRLLLAELLGVLHLPRIRRRILADLHLAVEQACDEVAAGQSGDRLQVAETILRLTRLIGSTASPAGVAQAAFTGSDAALRVEGLLRPPIPQRPAFFASVSALAIGMLLLGLASSDWWHHGAETFLGHLLG